MIICGNCGEKHETVQQVKDCHTGVASPPDRSRPATEKQIDFAQALLRQREPYGVIADVEKSNSIEAACEYINQMDFNQISEFIGRMKAQPLRGRKRKEPVHAEVTEGMYVLDGKVYKVQRAVHGSGHLYAKNLSSVDGKFHYSPGVISFLKPGDKMTTEEAKEFGHLYGVCCVCGRTLTDEESIANGIGPICASKEGWFR